MKIKGCVQGSWTDGDNIDIWKKHKNSFLKQKILAHSSIIAGIINKIEKENPVILELGCGSGNYCIFLASLGYKVLASDVETSAIELTRARADFNLSDDRKNNLRYLLLDAQNMSLPDNSVDIIFNVGAIEHIDIEKVLKESHRVLKKNGWMISVVPYLSLRWDMFWKISCLISKGNPYTQFLSREEWQETYGKTFENVQISSSSFIFEALMMRMFGAKLIYEKIIPRILNTEIFVAGQKKV